MRKSFALAVAAVVPLGLATASVAAAPQSATAASPTYKMTYAPLPDGSKQLVRWNGCQRAITYKVNLSGIPSSMRAAVLAETKATVSQVAVSTRFTFAYKGTTTEVPRSGSMPRQSAEIIIAYVAPSKTNLNLSGSVLGQGGLYYGYVGRTAGGRTSYTVAALRGFVVIDAPQMVRQAKGGYGTGLRRANVLAHELGHVMGMQHVSDGRQQMYPTIRAASPRFFSAHERVGLSRVGKASGCVNTAYMPLKDLS